MKITDSFKRTIPFFYRNNFTENRKVEIKYVVTCGKMLYRFTCRRGAKFIKTENIGPRYYAVYECNQHGKFRVRINEYTPLKKKCHICNKMVDPIKNKIGHCFEGTCFAKIHKSKDDPLTLY